MGIISAERMSITILFFFARTIREWNELPCLFVDIPALEEFLFMLKNLKYGLHMLS